MKTELIDVSQTEKNLIIEIPSTQVDAEIERVARDYTRAARIPGFRPGKVPAKLVRRRYRDQILHDVANGLIPRAVDEAMRERSIDPVDTPDIRDVVVEEGQPLRFTAAFETVPPIDPGPYDLTLRKPVVAIADEAVDQALERLRDRAARYDPIEGRGIEPGDTAVVDLERFPPDATDGESKKSQPERHENLSIEIGAKANPPGFDEALLSLEQGAEKRFTVTYPSDYEIGELAGKEVGYHVVVRGIKLRVRPPLDDEFAKDLGDFDSLSGLRARVREDLERQAEQEASREVRADLAKQLADRVSADVPAALVGREMDRRVEDFVRRLAEQRIDARRVNIDWDEFRERQREPATEAVKAALMLDEVARREGLVVDEEDITRELEGYAQRTGRTVSAVRARIENEGGLTRIHLGLQREKAIDFLLSRATIVPA